MRSVQLALARASCAAALVGSAGCTNGGDVAGSRHHVDELGVFELEGDPLDDPVGAPHDWSTVRSFVPGGVGVPSNLIANTGIVPDPDLAGTASVLSTGGSKDNNDFDEWVHQPDGTPGPQDKDKITNAYAAAYEIGDDLVIYFGADRFAQNGAAHLGFWFLQGELVPLEDGSFDGAHQVGDVLVQANFVNGGSTELIEVYQWVGSGGSHGPLHRLFTSTEAECEITGDPGGQVACAITNSGPETAPWPYTPKSGPAGTFPADGFFEGGINLSAIFEEASPGQPLPCFATFMAETRSSHPFDSTLRDFVLHSFPVCGLSAAKACTAGRIAPAGSPAAFEYTFQFTVNNTGLGLLHDLVIEDPVGTVIASRDTLGPEDPAWVVNHTAFSNDNTAFSNSAIVRAAVVDGGEKTLTAPVTSTCADIAVNPSITITKECTTRLVQQDDLLVVEVEFDVRVCNTSTPAGLVPVEDIVIRNDPANTPSTTDGTIIVADLDLAADECRDLEDFTYNPSVPGLGLDISFMDTVSASGGHAPASLGGATAATVTGSDSCALCPAPLPE